jgi:NAD(P)H-dependent flavin oxidoreductase YrpB (nitropropane dioxygenase family)
MNASPEFSAPSALAVSMNRAACSASSDGGLGFLDLIAAAADLRRRIEQFTEVTK